MTEMNENLSYLHNIYLDGLRRTMKLFKILRTTIWIHVLLNTNQECKSVHRDAQSLVFVAASLHRLYGFVKILVWQMELVSASLLYLGLRVCGGQPALCLMGAEVKKPECGSSPPFCSDCAGRLPQRFFACITYWTGCWEIGRHVFYFLFTGSRDQIWVWIPPILIVSSRVFSVPLSKC
jgi:hypothetical protein